MKEVCGRRQGEEEEGRGRKKRMKELGGREREEWKRRRK